MTKLSPSGSSRIAVIGAGTAGLACASRLSAHGLRPTVFEKSHGLGGRLATRRNRDGTAFDHGAQYVTARSAGFQRLIDDAIYKGEAARWSPLTSRLIADSDPGWVVGTPTMNAFVKPLADGIDIRRKTEVRSIRWSRGSWHVHTAEAGEGEVFDIIISTAPAPQVRMLLASEEWVQDALVDVAMAPCWALMVVFSSAFEPGFDVWRSDEGAITWIARNGSKPMRDGIGQCWIAHASTDWSRHHLELDRERAEVLMIKALRDALNRPLPEIGRAVAHRWRYARTTGPLGQPYLSAADDTLFIGGDWCIGARVESAFNSGNAIAEAIVGAAGN